MATYTPLRGVIAPIVTPFEDSTRIAAAPFAAHAHRVLAGGCAGLAPFGTTGEALSIGIEERIAGLEALAEAGVDPARMIPRHRPHQHRRHGAAHRPCGCARVQCRDGAAAVLLQERRGRGVWWTTTPS